ncbi:hypothetical protein NKG94_18435 [Micromonospora sp. M12]
MGSGLSCGFLLLGAVDFWGGLFVRGGSRRVFGGGHLLLRLGRCAGVDGRRLDVTDRAAVRALVAEVRPDAVVGTPTGTTTGRSPPTGRERGVRRRRGGCPPGARVQ